VDFVSNLVEGRFKVRLNRFLALVDVKGQEVAVHVPNTGRMRELLVPGYRVLITPRPEEHRKTGFDLALVDLGPTLASADARLPNALVEEALIRGCLPQFWEYPKIRREVTFGESRLDLLLERPGGRCYLEAKSVTLVVDGVGLFPDAPTARGAKHVRSLARAVAAGHRAAVVFVVQRDDALAFAPNDTADPEFGMALREGIASGVEVFAYGCRVTERSITLGPEIPIRLGPVDPGHAGQ
jgi:sugar fermentation stimulation protein A|tara:strand:+ start:2931 stop:3650 length:720 start_codon:yes stop_codon:yes gene_type:complete